MRRQSEELERFATLQQEMQKAIVARDWDELDAIMNRQIACGSEIERIEDERVSQTRRLTASLGIPETSSVSELRNRLGRDLSRRLLQAQRSLEIALMKVRGITGGIDAYLTGAIRTNREVLDRVFPDQRGTMYSRRGQRAQADNRAIVVDRKL